MTKIKNSLADEFFSLAPRYRTKGALDRLHKIYKGRVVAKSEQEVLGELKK